MHSLRIVPVLLVAGLIGHLKFAKSAEPLTVVRGPLSFSHLCASASYCPKPLPGIPCPPPALCKDDYCPKPLPRVSLCWPKGCIDDYCAKPLPLCWPRDPCADHKSRVGWH